MRATETSAASQPRRIGAAPPAIARDRMAQGWAAASTISWLGDSLWTVALAWTAAHTLSPGLAGLVLGIQTLPQAVLMLFGGVLADRWNTRRVVATGQLAQAVVLVLGALAWTAGARGAPTLIAIAIGFGLSVGLTLPSAATLPRQLVRAEDLTTLSGWTQIGNRLGRLAGAPLGGLVVAAAGPVPAMILDAATFVVLSAYVVVFLRPRYALPRDAGSSLRSSLTDGVAYLRRTASARLLVLALAALNVFVSPVIALGIALRCSQSHWGAHWVGLAEGVFAVGAIAGSAYGIGHRPVAPASTALRTLVLQGAALACVCVPWRPGLLAATALIGLTAGTASVWLSGVFQRTIAPSHLGRVSSVSNIGDLALLPLAIPVFGVVAGHAGLPFATICFGVAMAVLCAFFASQPALRALR